MRSILNHFYRETPFKNRLIGSLKLVWSWNHEIFILVIFAAALFLRLQNFNNPDYHYIGDYNRDFLIAHHILEYHEFPLVGPNGRFGQITQSPIYFYFLALPLLIKDDIIFLGLFNVFLQLAALLLVYLLGRMMFGKPVGLGALAIFATNQHIIDQSNTVWQPHIMQPFLLLSILLLFLSYTYKRYWVVLSSIALFMFASVMHQSVLALVPFYLLTVYLILRVNQTKSWQHYAGIILYFFGSFILLYAPLLFYLLQNHTDVTSFLHPASTFFSGNNEGIILRLFSRTELLLSVFFTHNPFAWLMRNTASQYFFAGIFLSTFSNSLPPTFLLILASVLALTLFYFWRNRGRRRFMCSLAFGAILSFLTIATLAGSPHFYVRHLTPLFGIFAICIVEIVYGIAHGKSQKWIVSVPLIFILIFSSSQDRIFGRLATAIKNARTDPNQFFMPQYKTPPFVMPLIQEIAVIKAKERKKDFSFFDIRVYGDHGMPYFLGTFWVALERNFDAHLVMTDDHNSWNFTPTGFSEYIFFYCEFAQNARSQCINSFLRGFPDFHITKELSSHPLIYEAQRTF